MKKHAINSERLQISLISQSSKCLGLAEWVPGGWGVGVGGKRHYKPLIMENLHQREQAHASDHTFLLNPAPPAPLLAQKLLDYFSRSIK